MVTGDPAGRYQLFQFGAMYWTPSTGAQPVRGGMRAAWDAVGQDGGALGFPTSDELPAADGAGRVQNFQGGAIYYSDATGAHPVRGAIRTTWSGRGGETGILGYPTGREQPAAGGGSVQQFQRGVIAFTAGTGAHPVWGSVRAAWDAAGAEGGELGYPAAAEAPGPTGVGAVQAFQRGTIHWTAPTRAHPVSGALADAWAARGGATGLLGLPDRSSAAVERCGHRPGLPERRAVRAVLRPVDGRARRRARPVPGRGCRGRWSRAADG